MLKGAEAFGHQSADQAKQHNTILVSIIAKVAFVGENGKICFHIDTSICPVNVSVVLSDLFIANGVVGYQVFTMSVVNIKTIV